MYDWFFQTIPDDTNIKSIDALVADDYLTVIRGLLECVKALHDENFVHRDIHPGSYLFYWL